MAASVNGRELVLDILLQITRDGEYTHIALKNVLDKYQYLDKKERAFITRVVNGTLDFRKVKGIMADGLIMDTILHFGEILMSGVSRVVFPALSYIVYIFLSFFIPSSSGLATATIPIIGSLGEFLGVGKEFAVMVCAAGSETMNLISPTQAVRYGGISNCHGVPFPRWVKAVLPFFFIVIAIVSIVVTIAVLL